jgi:hypothetical protein
LRDVVTAQRFVLGAAVPELLREGSGSTGAGAAGVQVVIAGPVALQLQQLVTVDQQPVIDADPLPDEG